MTVDKDCYLTETGREYKWPYPIPLEARPPPPPLVTKPKNLYVTQAKPCQCYAHQNDSQPSARLNELAQKQVALCQELNAVKNELNRLSKVAPDDKPRVTTYQIDYDTKKGSVDEAEDLKDINNFKTIAFGEFASKNCVPNTFKKTPKPVDEWFRSKTGRSEYQDTISKIGMSLLKNMAQYLEPLPSSQKRQGDTGIF